MRLTNNEGVLYAIDAVSGETGTQAISTLGRGGRLLVYGALSLEPIVLDPRVLLLGQKRVEGFWLSEWVRDQGILTMLFLFRKIGQLMCGGTLATEVGRTFLAQRRFKKQSVTQFKRAGRERHYFGLPALANPLATGHSPRATRGCPTRFGSVEMVEVGARRLGLFGRDSNAGLNN